MPSIRAVAGPADFDWQRRPTEMVRTHRGDLSGDGRALCPGLRPRPPDYINDKVVVCVLENILTDSEDIRIAQGAPDEVIDGRVAFQTDTQTSSLLQSSV